MHKKASQVENQHIDVTKSLCVSALKESFSSSLPVEEGAAMEFLAALQFKYVDQASVSLGS